MRTCEKCFKPLYACPACNGTGGETALFGLTKLTCSQCRNTGSRCPDHDGFWER